MRTHNLFISHSWTYSDQYDRFVHLIEAAPRFDFRNYSVPKDDPVHTRGTDRELRAAILNHMRPCHVVVILAGVYASYSKWIDTEVTLAQAFRTSKPILAVRPWGNRRISQAVQDAADEVVNWNTASIVAAIRRLSDA